jgi:hypothetical protein
MHVLPVVLLSPENRETGEESVLGMIYVFHLSLQFHALFSDEWIVLQKDSEIRASLHVKGSIIFV